MCVCVLWRGVGGWGSGGGWWEIGLSVISSMYQLTHGLSNFYFIREFSKRMDIDLPFHYWTLNERYSEDAYPSFDNRPDIDEDEDARNHPLRLHRLRINQREDSSIFVVGRAHLPARHRQTIRQSFHRPGNYLAPPPN